MLTAPMDDSSLFLLSEGRAIGVQAKPRPEKVRPLHYCQDGLLPMPKSDQNGTGKSPS